MTERFIIDDCGTLIDIVTRNTYDYVSDVAPLLNALAEQNVQLQERNDRQANSLDELYNLIEKQDWEALKQIIQDFKESDEQLQKEWKCY